MSICLPEGELASSNARSFDVAVLLNGTFVTGITEVFVSCDSHSSASRFRLRSSLAATGYGLWSQSPLRIEIRISLDGGWADLLLGTVDKITVDVGLNEVVVDGRDLTASLIDSQIQESFENQTSSDVAILLAGRHGLTPNVTPTAPLIGRNFQNDHVRTLLGQHAPVMTEWDLLVRLADREGFDIWVSQSTLNFTPQIQDPLPILLTPQDCVSLKLEKSCILDAGFSVAVKSWDCRGSQIIAQQAASQNSVSEAAKYTFIRPNLDAQSAQDFANRVAGLISQRGRTIWAEMPGDLATMPRRGITLANTNTDFDGGYVVTSVERHISFAHGFTQFVEATLPPWTTS
jgi:phage protein D